VIASDIEWGLAALGERRPYYELYEAYYDGRHRLAFASDRFTTAFGSLFRAFASNLCPTVVDVLADRLQVLGFADAGNADAESLPAQGVWDDSRMDAQAGDLHREALVKGDAYLIVWQDTSGFPQLYLQDSRQVIVAYDSQQPGRVRFAVKVWPVDGAWRVTAYYDDRIERYVTRRRSRTASQDFPAKASTLRPITPEDVGADEDANPVVAHAWGVVPVFHFPNNSRIGALGRSELHDVIPLQDALNKTIADLLVGSEFHALPQRYTVGLEAPLDKHGRPVPAPVKPGEILALPAQSSAGQFPAADLRPMREIADGFALDIARVSGTPLHLMMLHGADWPSGEALKTAEARLVKKARDRIATWGPVWADAMSLALRMGQQDATRIRALYDTPETRVSEREQGETAVIHQTAGIPRPVTWKNVLGYSDEQIEQMIAQAAEEARARAENARRAFNAGAALEED
jgi:hypothetical protein